MSSSSYSVLMVAEKPSICTSVAEALYGQSIGSKSSCKVPASNSSRGPTPVYEFPSIFNNKPARFKITAVTGHLFSLDFPSKYQNWDAIDPLELFSAPTIKTTEGRNNAVVRHLQHEAKGVDALVLWMDCDREGENICFEVIQTVLPSMNKAKTGPHSQPTILRAKFSAVTFKDIEKAMQQLVLPNENEAKSVDARQELDLKVGVAFSRFQTRYFQGKYGNLDSAIISYGPCQTPTLGFCVQRHDEIQSFVPEPFWSIDAQLHHPSSSQKIKLAWQRGRLFDQNIVEMFAHMVQQSQRLLCYDVKISETRKTRPQPLNTVELLKLASKKLGIGPQAAMRAAEHLYLSGYLSYPRTESTSYPKSFDIREALSIQRDHPEWGSYAQKLLRDGYTQPRQGHDAGDHPPITPVGLATELSGDNHRIYELVATHFLATVSRDATFQQTKAKFRADGGIDGGAGGEEFSLVGKKPLDPGFLSIYAPSGRDSGDRDQDVGEDGDEDEELDEKVELFDIPEFRIGTHYSLHSATVREGRTTAPGYLTESELIGLMEKNGIGTDASIPTHINNILTRNYVALGSGRTLIPTELGIVLVHGYLRIDPDLVLPQVRSTIESFCSFIAKGSATKEQVVLHSLASFEKKFEYFRHNIGSMDSLFEASFSPLAATGKPLSKCGKCLRYMRFIPLKPQRLYCPTCAITYALPQNGTIKLYKELKCPLDQFDLVLFSLGNTEKAQGKSYPLCPCCYNFPPNFDDIESLLAGGGGGKEGGDEEDGGNGKGDGDEEGDDEEEAEDAAKIHHMGCNACLHPSCKHSAIQNGICQCPGTADGGNCDGMLVLDVNSKPNWKLACNECNTLIRFKGEIHNISPQVRKECETCGVRVVTIEFNKTKPSPLKSGEMSITGCIVCNETMHGMTEVMAGRTINLTILRQMRQRRAMMGGRGKGRGRGRGGRGRGRGKRMTKDQVLMSFEDF